MSIKKGYKNHIIVDWRSSIGQIYYAKNQIDFDFVEGKINLCDARGNVNSYFQKTGEKPRDFMQNQASGEQMHLVIENNEIIEIIMKQKVQGIYKFKQK